MRYENASRDVEPGHEIRPHLIAEKPKSDKRQEDVKDPARHPVGTWQSAIAPKHPASQQLPDPAAVHILSKYGSAIIFQTPPTPSHYAHSTPKRQRLPRQSVLCPSSAAPQQRASHLVYEYRIGAIPATDRAISTLIRRSSALSAICPRNGRAMPMLKATVPRQGRVSTALSWRNVAAVAGRGWTACTRLRGTAARARSGIVSLDGVEGGHLMV